MSTTMVTKTANDDDRTAQQLLTALRMLARLRASHPNSKVWDALATKDEHFNEVFRAEVDAEMPQVASMVRLAAAGNRPL